MTPAMEEIAQLIKRNLELASQAKVSNLNNSRRLTRSESAKLRRNFIFRNHFLFLYLL